MSVPPASTPNNSSHSIAKFGWSAPSSMPQLSAPPSSVLPAVGLPLSFGGSTPLPALSSGPTMTPPPSTPTTSTTTASSSGWKNAVTLQQLSGFGMRNLSAYGATCGALMDVYFKLVLDRQVVYVSEIVRNTLNPVWVPFQPEDMAFGDGSVRQLLSGTFFDVIVVRVKDRRRPRRKSRALSGRLVEDDAWEPNTRPLSDCAGGAESGDESEQQKAVGGVDDGAVEEPVEEEILGMSFSVRELEPLPVGVAEITNLPLNTCLFEFNGRTYVRREVTELLIESGVISAKHSRRKGSAIQLKEYSLLAGVESLQRILATRAQIGQVTAANDALKKQIEQRLCAAQPDVSKELRRAALEDRVRALRAQAAEKKGNLERLKSVMHDERKTFETDIHIPKALLKTMQMSMRYKDEKQGILERRCEVLRAAHKIRSRQAMLVKQLSAVYPIEYEGAGEYKIRGIKITNSDLTGGGRTDEEMISTALGYIAHLVFMLSKYLQVNLRYRVLLFSRGLDPTQGAPILGRLKALTDAEASWLLSEREFNASNSVPNGTLIRR
ncbi:hypothetical protein PybrP1_005887 [[Pythium] brassicae (nom. inval.)]|nr:hypothetical protein PybrP1_005887 [[Pythium] brassicae (nom. inval.)]